MISSTDPQEQPSEAPQPLPNPVVTASIAARVAICFLAQQPGLPAMAFALRQAVVMRHEAGCDWCDFPPPILVGWLYDYLEWDALQDAKWTSRVAARGYSRRAA